MTSRHERRLMASLSQLPLDRLEALCRSEHHRDKFSQLDDDRFHDLIRKQVQVLAKLRPVLVVEGLGLLPRSREVLGSIPAIIIFSVSGAHRKDKNGEKCFVQLVNEEINQLCAYGCPRDCPTSSRKLSRKSVRVLIGPKYLSLAILVSLNATKIILGVKNVIKQYQQFLVRNKASS